MKAARLSVDLPVEGHMSSFDGATGWLNSPPLTESDLRDHVVLVDFWTYTCINWLRTLGYVRAWAAKYEDQGLIVVGVHTPEFPFEADVDNVRWAARDMTVEYPIALDSSYAVWPPSTIGTGRPSTSPTRRDESGTTNSARADTRNARPSCSGCCATRGGPASVTIWSRFPTKVSRPKRIGRTWSRPRPTSAMSGASALRPRVVPN